jgi:hypothetical protein
MGYNECSPVVLAATISALMPGAYALLAIAQAKIPVAHNSTKHPAVQCWSHITPPRRCHFFTPIRCSKKKKKKITILLSEIYDRPLLCIVGLT